MNIYTSILILFLIGPILAIGLHLLWRCEERKVNKNDNNDHNDC